MNRFESPFKPLMWFMALLLSALLAACGGGGGGGGGSDAASAAAAANVLPGIAGTLGAAATNPTVVSSSPSSGATGVATSTSTGAGPVLSVKVLTATFNAAMNPATITPVGTFTLKTAAGTNVPGVVTMNGANTIATFTPGVANLDAATTYTATITTTAKNAGGTAMPNPVVWSFTTAAALTAAAAPVNLGTAGNYTILAETTISNALTAGTAITGDIGISPAAATFITGFGLAMDVSLDFSTTTPSTLVTGRVYAADYVSPGPGDTPAALVIAIADSRAAYTDAATRPAATLVPFLNPGAGNLGGLTLAPGLYSFTGGSINVTIPTDVTLDGLGDADAVWIFQIPGTLDMANSMKVNLIRSAKAKNIFWQVAGTVTLQGGTSQFEGVVLTASDVAMVTGGSANSRLLAQTQVALDSNTVTPPAP